MTYSIENNFLRLSVSTTGAEPVSVIKKETGEEMLWQADEAVWGRHAPLLFPYCGRLKDGHYLYDGNTYEGGQHGFGRDMEFALGAETADSLTLVLQANVLTMEKYPFAFKLSVTFTLSGTTVCQHVAVENEDDKEFCFGLGFHPGFACPFDAAHTPEDYTFAFDVPQTPTLVDVNTANGLVTGKSSTYFTAQSTIPLSNHLFDNDSLCFAHLSAKTLSITEKDTGKKVSVDISEFPYVLIWAPPHKPVQFVCIEPWHTLPDREDATGVWEDKQPAITLAPGHVWNTELKMTFDR